jgi:hypothetical protein
MMSFRVFSCFFIGLIFATLAGSSAALAQGVFDEAITQGANIFASASPILQGIGLLGILGVSGMTMVGKMPWGWAFALTGGLVLVMLSGAIVDWVLLISGAPEIAKGESVGEFKDVADRIYGASNQLHTDTRDILYIASGTGIIALGIMGLFGKFPWSWFFTITSGLVVLGVADQLVLNFFDGAGGGITISAPK